MIIDCFNSLTEQTSVSMRIAVRKNHDNFDCKWACIFFFRYLFIHLLQELCIEIYCTSKLYYTHNVQCNNEEALLLVQAVKKTTQSFQYAVDYMQY